MPDKNETEKEKILITWKAKSRPYNPDQDKSRSVMLVMGVLITIILLLAGEWMIIVLMAAAAFYYYAQNRIPPEEVEYSITNKGLKAYGRVYLWWEFKSWWIEPKLTESLLAFDLISGVMGRMYIPLGAANQAQIQKILSEYLENNKPEDTTVTKMTKWVSDKFPLENKI